MKVSSQTPDPADTRQTVSFRGETRFLEDLLAQEGIRTLGFGVIPKRVMQDEDLRINAKGLYGYHAACAKDGVCFPSRDTICEDLQIGSVKTYYSYWHDLLKQGLITAQQKRRTNSLFAHNIYTLVSNPIKYTAAPKAAVTEASDILRASSFLSDGYGLVPRALMIDRRLHLTAKGIMLLFLSYAGAGDTAFPRRAQILRFLKLNKATYTKYLGQLIRFGYLSVRQIRVDGRYSVNEYTIEEYPVERTEDTGRLALPAAEEAPCTKYDHTVQEPDKPTISPCTKNDHTADGPPERLSPCTKKGYTKEGYTKKGHTNSNSLNNNSLNNNSKESAAVSLPSIHPQKDGWKAGRPTELDLYETKRLLVREQLHLPYLEASGQIKDPELFDTLVDLVVRTLLGKTRPVRVEGADVPLTQIQQAFGKLTGADLLAVIDSFKAAGIVPRNPGAYLTTCLYNQAMASPFLAEAEYRRDLKDGWASGFARRDDENWDGRLISLLPLDQMPDFRTED